MVDQPSKNEIEIVLVSHMGHNGTSGKSQLEIEIVCGPEGPFFFTYFCFLVDQLPENAIEIDLVSCNGPGAREKIF